MASGSLTNDSPATADLAAARRRFALWVIYGVIGIHVVAMIAKIDQWPLSYFGMYSHVQPAQTTWPVPYGVTPDGREVRLQEDHYWRPLGASRLSFCLRRMQQDGARLKGDLPSAGSAVQGDKVAQGDKADRTIRRLLIIYENNRRAGLHDGPTLAGLRLYNVTWRIAPDLGNLDAPDRRELVGEYVAAP
jgi:hypothetical protein